jgi:hypothetical protein
MDVDNAARYHVVLEGRRVGPYDRRTIVGMRIKQTLSSDHVLIDSQGTQLTVADLLAQRDAGRPSFNPSQSGAFSIVKGTYSAALAGVSGRGVAIPDFRGEMEVRVQSDVLRLAGRCRQMFGTRDTRIKIPLTLLAMGQAQGSRVDLWLRSATDVVVTAESPLQRLSLDLFSPETARELLAALPPMATPNAAQSQAANIPATHAFLTWGALVAVVVVIGGVLVALLTRRV